jgi:hypothetical protein
MLALLSLFFCVCCCYGDTVAVRHDRMVSTYTTHTLLYILHARFQQILRILMRTVLCIVAD